LKKSEARRDLMSLKGAVMNMVQIFSYFFRLLASGSWLLSPGFSSQLPISCCALSGFRGGARGLCAFCFFDIAAMVVYCAPVWNACNRMLPDYESGEAPYFEGE
jgi:hypothetical protein